MKKSKKAFIDFYTSINRIPTRQNIQDFDAHLQRRIALYVLLGLPPALIKDRDVIELGPGSGHNSIITALFSPKNYTLLDGNKTSIDSTRAILDEHFPGNNFEYVQADMEKYIHPDGYDIVICEGVIPGQDNPTQFLKKISRLVRKGGILLITSYETSPMLPEILRRIQGRVITQGIEDLDTQIQLLQNFFSPHLKNLKNMSRKHEDWIIDQIIHPWKGTLISIADSIRSLQGEFLVCGSSPRFLEDWRWYKDIKGLEFTNCGAVLDSYFRKAHNLIDNRFLNGDIDPKVYAQIENFSEKIFFIEKRMHESGKVRGLDMLEKCLAGLLKIFRKTNPGTVPALQEFLSDLRKGDIARRNQTQFSKWWGRGQQYLSFVRIQ